MRFGLSAGNLSARFSAAASHSAATACVVGPSRGSPLRPGLRQHRRFSKSIGPPRPSLLGLAMANDANVGVPSFSEMLAREVCLVARPIAEKRASQSSARYLLIHPA